MTTPLNCHSERSEESVLLRLLLKACTKLAKMSHYRSVLAFGRPERICKINGTIMKIGRFVISLLSILTAWTIPCEAQGPKAENVRVSFASFGAIYYPHFIAKELGFYIGRRALGIQKDVAPQQVFDFRLVREVYKELREMDLDRALKPSK
jgi:hypothetical protein